MSPKGSVVQNSNGSASQVGSVGGENSVGDQNLSCCPKRKRESQEVPTVVHAKMACVDPDFGGEELLPEEYEMICTLLPQLL